MAMLSVEQALERVLSLSTPLGPVDASIDDALGRALAIPVTAARTLPPWHNSAMDGYAVRAEGLSAGAVLSVVERIFAGQTPSKTIHAGECARIMTGAPLPPGADAVVMQEHAQALSEAQVKILEPAVAGQNVRRRGEDVLEGTVLLPARTPIGLAEAGLLWAQGFTTVSVARRPRVAVVTSGDELCAVGDAPGGRIVDSSSPVLAAAAGRAGAMVTPLGIVPDRLEAMVQTFRRGLKGHDVLLAIAGASAGEKDFTRQAFEQLGVTLDFWQVAMKPGKPLAVGRAGDTLVFGLPGNPISAMVTFELFVRPALRAMQGLTPQPNPLPGRAQVAIEKPRGLRHFVRATVSLRDGALWATPLTTQSSGSLTSAVGATHLISLPPDSAGAAAGDEIVLIPLSWID